MCLDIRNATHGIINPVVEYNKITTSVQHLKWRKSRKKSSLVNQFNREQIK